MTQQMEKWAEIRNKEGETQWTVWLNPAAAGQHGAQKQWEGGGSFKDGFMSDAQKRYLFRLLAEKGIEGEEAYEHLRKTFGVEYLGDVSKQEASRAIDQLLKGEREVNHDSEIASP